MSSLSKPIPTEKAEFPFFFYLDDRLCYNHPSGVAVQNVLKSEGEAAIVQIKDLGFKCLVYNGMEDRRGKI